MQYKSKIGMVISGILGSLSIGKAIYAAGGILNMFSIGSNIASGVTHLENYEKSKDLIIKLKQKLKDAIKLNNEINIFIDQLIKELDERKKKRYINYMNLKHQKKN